MPALQAAIAFPQVHDRTGTVAEDLDFDMTRQWDESLGVQRAVAESRLGFCGTTRKRARDRLVGPQHLHAATATAGRCLEYHGHIDA